MDSSVTTSQHHVRHMFVSASQSELAPASIVTPVEANRSQPPPAPSDLPMGRPGHDVDSSSTVAVVGRLLRHPLVLAVMKIILERLVE